MHHSALINVMVAAARKAARSLKRDFGEVENLQVSLKGPANFVTAADRRAEETLRAELAKVRPGYGFLGEESGKHEGSDATHTWIVDPLDGTTNFLHGIPQFAISIGLERSGAIVAGVIYNPITDEMFTAERGKGAYPERPADRGLRRERRSPMRWSPAACRIAAAATSNWGLRSLRRFRTRSRASGASAQPPSTSPMSPRDGSTATGSRTSRPWDIAAGIIADPRGRRLCHRHR